MNFLNNIEPRDDLDLKQDNSHQKPAHESTTTSINDESQKNFIETNIYYSNNINNNYSINMDIQNDSEDIFPPERLGGDFKYINDERNNYSILNNQLNSNVIENIFAKNRNIIMKEDIPEMLLYKFNYDINLLKESIADINYESQWLFDFLNVRKTLKGNYIEEKSIEIKQCLKNLLTEHKLKKLDIPYIIVNCQDFYDKYFTQTQVFEILSVYDVEFLRLQKKRKRINNIFNYISQKEDTILNKEIGNYFKLEYILNAKNESELDIIEIQLGILAYVYQSNEIDENYKKLFNSKVLTNLNIDFISLNKVKENKLYDIIKKFCLTPEQVTYNLKILTGEDKVNSELITPPFPNCSLGDLCQQKISELNGKFTSSKEVLKLSLEYYILLLSTHPYIFNLISKKLFNISTLTTVPSDKGNDILNTLHPLYHCKRINKMPISSFFEEKNECICNIYTNENGELYLQIEKCYTNGLIKYDIITGANTLEHSPEIEKLINLLANAVNGIKDDNNDKRNDNDNPLILKNIGARTVAVRNMITIRNYSQGLFINYIKKELHKYSEKYIIKKISSEFFNLISRNYLDKVVLDRNSNFCSIIYNIQQKHFKCYWLDSNYRYICEMVLEYLWKNDKFVDTSLNETLCLSKEIDEFKKYMMMNRPKVIVIDVSNLECYKMINCIRSKFRDCNLVYSDYNSKINKIKFVEITHEQEIKQAIDQVRYVVHPVNQIIDLWNYKYEENLLLNLSFHQLQENIKDIPLLNYSLENQIIRVVNSKPIIIEDLFKYSYNLFNFICGFGPSTSSYIIDNINEPENIKMSLRGKNPIIYENINQFIKENISSRNCNLYDIKNDKNNIGLKKSEVFYSMINDPIYFKKNCLCNAIVSDIDQKGKVVNCILLRDCNNIKAILKFANIDQNITNYQTFFYPQRIILCKIIDIILRHHSYEIILSNKNEDLKTVKDFLAENKNLKYNINNDEKDFTIKEIKILEEMQQIDQKNLNKTLKYYPINMENEQFLMNSNYSNIKKFFQCYRSVEYKIRPSFLGENHLTLTLKVIDDIYLNYDIEISKIELDNYNMNNEKTYVTNYKIEDVSYKSLNELVDTFAVRILKKIKDFKKNACFFPPADIRNLFFQIFNIKSNIVPTEKKNEAKNKMRDYDYDYEKDKDDIIKKDDIILGFMKESPEYGILFTKANNEYNYTIDFIRILHNGYLFHGRLFNSLNEIINFYKDFHNTNHYQNFIKRQFICNIHAQIEEMDEKYIEFEGTKPYLEKYYQNDAKVRELKDGLLDSQNTFKEFIGKKRKADNDTNDAWEQMDSNNAWDNNGENNINDNDNGVWGKSNKNSKNNKKWNPNFNMNNNNNEQKKNKNNNNFNKSKTKFNGNKRSSQNNNNNNFETNNDPWGSSNNNNNDAWNTNNNNVEASNDNWNSSKNNNNNELSFNNWNTSNNNNDDWTNNNSNNNNKNIWGKSSKPKKKMENSNKDDSNWGSQNNNDDWANSNNTDSWGNSNNNNNNINNSSKMGTWENSNNASAWDNPKIDDNKGINNISWDNDNKNNDDTWANSENNKNDNNNSNRNNPKKNKFNKKINQNNKNNKSSNFSWAKDNNNNNNENNSTTKFTWPNSNNEEKTEDWGNNTDNNNAVWGKANNNNSELDWGSQSNNNNDNWDSPNVIDNENKNINWGKSNNDSNNNFENNNKKTYNNWTKKGNNNKAKDSWGTSDNSNSNNNWENSNKANADDAWGNSNNAKGNDTWGNNSNNNNKEENNWKNSNNANAENSWGNGNDNMEKNNWANSNNSTTDNIFGNDNNNDSWQKPNNIYNNSKRNKDNNFRKNNNNNNSWNNNNNNNGNNNFSQRNNNKNSNKFQNNKNKNFNNRKNNNNWNNNNKFNKDNQNSNFIGWNQASNIKKEPDNFGEFNNNSFGKAGNKNHNKNAKKNWANTENFDIDIKQEKGEGVIDFAQKDVFGGYNVDENNE